MTTSTDTLQTISENVAPNDDDVSLMLRIAKGSESAFRILVDKWQRPLLNYFFRSCNDAQASEDLAQQTFLNIYKARESYADYIENSKDGKPAAKFSTYIFHIARNVLITEHRKLQRRPADATDPADLDFGESRQAETSTAELEEIFFNTLEKLPENQRTAILLLKQQQISYDEIADIMKSNVQSVKTWIHRARAALRDALKTAENFNK